MKRKIFYRSCLLMFLLGVGIVSGYGFDSTDVAKKGTADLRKVQLHNTFVALDGEWQFAPQQLLTPEQYHSFKTVVNFPQLWNSGFTGSTEMGSKGYATYGLTILLPTDRPLLALYLPSVYSSYRLYINGKIIASNGVPATTKNDYEPKWVPVTVSVPEGEDRLQLLLQVANFSHAKGGANLSVTIGDKDLLFLERERNLSIDFLLAGCLFMGGLFFLSLYLFGSRDKATLFFSLFCMAYSYRMVGSFLYSLHVLFPGYNWEIAIRMEYISLFGSIYLFLQYVHHLYPEEFNRKLMNGFYSICFLAGFLTLFTASEIFTWIITPFLATMFSCIGYLLFVFIKAYLNKRVAARYAMLSIATVLLVQLLSNLEYFGIILPSKIVLLAGHLAFFFLQSLILSFRFAYTLQLAKKQAELGSQAKSDFLSTMSHEIRTPLNSVIGMTNLIQKNNPRPDQAQQLDVLHFSANNLLSIVNDILDYSKIEAGKVRLEKIEMDIPGLMRNIVSGAKNIADEKGIGLELSLDHQLDELLLGDPTRLTQVMNNLVSNAVKFTRVGKVSVSVKVVSESQDAIGLLFSVKDTGIGIAKAQQELIFDKFTQADSSTSRGFGGTGLGLAITKKILLLQHAQLNLESEPGIGSEFNFILDFPLTGKKIAVNGRGTATSLTKQGLSGVAILLVEDNPINVLVAKTFLEGWGALVEVAENGQQALDLLEPNRHRMILMDLHMPVMDGYTAIQRIRSQGISIPIVALTASLPGEVEQEVKGLAIDDFVLKPFVPDELFNKVLQFTSPVINSTQDRVYQKSQLHYSP